MGEGLGGRLQGKGKGMLRLCSVRGPQRALTLISKPVTTASKMVSFDLALGRGETKFSFNHVT